MEYQGLSVLGLADKTGLSTKGIYNIINGISQNPQKTTRDKIEKALKSKPQKAIIDEIDAESSVVGMGNLEEFTPEDANEAPEVKGVYVFYDAFERPVYVGKAVKQTIRQRVDQHREKFWFRDPIVTKARFIEIKDAILCAKVESLLIKFLGSHNLLNKRGAEAYRPSVATEDT
jgi:transcriptional regulator with XRE-family HTH domain